MLIVNESGLNAIILRCRDAMTHGTVAHKYRKWVTSEVLPSIRKTGRYEALQAAPVPPSTAERLNGNDLQHIKRAIWLCVKNFQHTESWNQAIWYYLRQVACRKARVDEFRANAHHFYRQHPGMHSDR